MKATVGDHVLADSDDIVETGGYQYFPAAAVRMEWLQKTPRTESDLQCPHGVQFYDVVINGSRHPRAAWSHGRAAPSMQQVGGRFGFWEDVKVA